MVSRDCFFLRLRYTRPPLLIFDILSSLYHRYISTFAHNAIVSCFLYDSFREGGFHRLDVSLV